MTTKASASGNASKRTPETVSPTRSTGAFSIASLKMVITFSKLAPAPVVTRSIGEPRSDRRGHGFLARAARTPSPAPQRHHGRNAVASRTLLDICDTSKYSDATFDAVWPTEGRSHMPSRRLRTLSTGYSGLPNLEERRASVMSTLGSWRSSFGCTRHKDSRSRRDERAFTTVTFVTSKRSTCVNVSMREIVNLVERCGAELLAMSASNWSSLNDEEVLLELETHPTTGPCSWTKKRRLAPNPCRRWRHASSLAARR